jgi:F-type H+-transporting ATPase subunit b
LFRRTLGRATVVAALLLCAGSAVVAQDAHGEQPDIFAGTIGNAIVTLVIFALVVFILGKYAWPLILHGLNEREKRIRESLEDARREREEAERVLEKYTQQIEQARTEASAIVDVGRRNAQEAGRRVQEEARQEAAEMVERARREIRLAADAAKKEVYDLAAELAVDVAGRIIRKKLSPGDHKELVQESLERMKAQEPEMN